MKGYISALIDIHYRKLGKLGDNQKHLVQNEIDFIEELESILDYYQNKKEATKDTDQDSPR